MITEGHITLIVTLLGRSKVNEMNGGVKIGWEGFRWKSRACKPECRVQKFGAKSPDLSASDAHFDKGFYFGTIIVCIGTFSEKVILRAPKCWGTLVVCMLERTKLVKTNSNH